MQFIFPEYCYIRKSNRVIKKPFLHDTLEYVVVNTRTKEVYAISYHLKELFIYFKNPRDLNEFIDYLNEPLVDFISNLIKHQLLIIKTKNSYKNEVQTTNNKLLFNEFEFLKLIKQDISTTIALIKDKLGHVRVIKYLNDYSKKRDMMYFFQEFETYTHLGAHPLLCKLIEFNKTHKYGILEYVKGDTLGYLIRKNSLNMSQKQSLAHQIIQITSFLHSKNIIHGDINPAQFIVQSNFSIKLIDFEFSFKINEYKHIKRGGVYFYFEPEIITPNCLKKTSNYTPSFISDVYRIGILLYFLFYQEYPHEGVYWKEYYDKVKNNNIKFNLTNCKNERIPDHILHIMKKCLTKETNQRFRSACEIELFVINKIRSDI